MKLFFFLFFCLPLFSVTKTVCASGCDYTSFQTAVNAIVGDCTIDVIELRSGEKFLGSFAIPYTTCQTGVIVRSSRWKELPPRGTKVSTAHEYAMATLSTNTGSPTLRIYEQGENPVTIADLGTDTLTIGVSIPDLTPFSCTLTPPPPMVAGTVYYSKFVSSTQMQVSLTRGGPALDLTGQGSVSAIPGDYYTTPHCVAIKPRSKWTFTGIKVTLESGTSLNNSLVAVGSWESNENGSPNNIWFDRTLIVGHGNLSVDWPSGGITITSSKNIVVSDSYIAGIRCFNCEGKPVSLQSSPGPIEFRNNTILGGAIGVLLEGQSAKIPGLMVNNVRITGNYFSQPGDNMYREGAGAPTGSCYYGEGSGMFYRNTSSSGTTCSLSGRCYSCQSNNTWAIDLLAPYRDADFQPKNPIEIKGGTNIRIQGNIWRGQQSSMGSQGNCFLIVAAIDRYVDNVIYENNHCIDTFGGISTTSYSSPTATSKNVLILNNLVTGMGSSRLLNRIGDTSSDSIFQVRAPRWSGYETRRTTHVIDSATTVGTAWGLYAESVTTGMPAHTRPSHVYDNIWWTGTAGSRTDNAVSTCNSTTEGWGALFLNDGSKQVRNNLQYGGTSLGGIDACATSQNTTAVASIATVSFAVDGSLNPTSPYSAFCTVGCAYTATDGLDVGADIPRLKAALSGVQTGVNVNLQVQVNATRALLRYTAPTDAACDIALYPLSTPAVYHADTDVIGERTDSRTGNITYGRSRQVVLGYNTALTANTWYRFILTCGTSYGFAEFRTKAANSGGSATATYFSAISGEYSASPLMTSPTSISSGTTHTIPLSGVVYYKPQNRKIQILLEN